jgi:EmrB/QacA subfamily drug resistance transporter
MPSQQWPGRSLAAISAVVVLGAVMSILDATVVNVAIATLAREFGTDLSTIQWVSTGYLLALATVIPLTGWAADRFGARQVFLLSVVLFTAGSALAGLAWSAASLIGFRVVQGLGGGMLLPAGTTILMRAVGQQRVGRAMSTIGVPTMLAPVFGPVIGGWIVDSFSWHWIFYVNVPIGVLALALAYLVLPRDARQPAHRLDLVGLLLLSPGLTALVYGLAETTGPGGFGSPRVLVGLAAGTVLVAGYVAHALRAEHPLIDLQPFRQRAVAAAAGTTWLFAIAFFGSMLLLPLYFQVVRGDTPLEAGLHLAARGIGAAITMPIAGRLVDRSGPGMTVVAGLLVTALGTLPFTQVTASTSYSLLFVAQAVQGVGMGLAMMPAMSAAYQVLDSAAVARTTAALNSVQRVGGSIGTALLAVVLQHQIAAAIPGTGSAGLNDLASDGAATQQRIAPLLATSFGHSFWWALALFGLALVPAWLLPRHRPRTTESQPKPDTTQSQLQPAHAAGGAR